MCCLNKQNNIKHMKIKEVLVFILFVSIFSVDVSAQYLHSSGKNIVDGNGNNFLIRSMGLGGWMLMEGYMMETAGFAGTQREIRALIEKSMGKEKTDEFYKDWLANHVTKADIDSLAAWGFNAVRPALHYNLFTLPIEKEPFPGQDTWVFDGFKMLDNLIQWCKANNMYVILDLHAAPGGQGKNADISDYDPSKPSLWESSENRRKTVALWRKLAERYANEKWVGGYDLINETNWGFNGDNNGCSGNNEPLAQLYKDITKAIREVDKNHMIIVEGNCWANNMAGLFPPWDENMAYSFHKYWSDTNVQSIQDYVNLSEQYNVPMWMGESGENSNQWFYETIKMLESKNMGWSWWPMKKINSVVGPLTIPKSKEYQQLLDTWNRGATPDATFCYYTLKDLAKNAKIENCIKHPDVWDAMFRQQQSNATVPYKTLQIPGTVRAVDFDMGRLNSAYFDKDYMNDKGNGAATWNNGWVYRNDGVDIETCSDTSAESNGYNVAWMEAGEWMKYTVDVRETGTYEMAVRVASPGGKGKFVIESDQKKISGDVLLVQTGGWQIWKDLVIKDVVLYKGKQTLRFFCTESGFNLNYFKFTKTSGHQQTAFKPLNAFTSENGDTVFLAVNKHVAPTSGAISGISMFKNGWTTTVKNVSISSSDSALLVLSLSEPLKKSDQVTLSYNSGNLKSEHNQALGSFSNLAVENKTLFRQVIPGLMEAENYSVNFGLSLENCTDNGGGSNIAYTHPGDYLDYPVWVEKEGRYVLTYRVASGNAAGGKIELHLPVSENQVQVMQSTALPYTGGWQNWQNVVSEVYLPAGRYTLRAYVANSEFNLNWIKFEPFTTTSAKNIADSDIQLYPNPSNEVLNIQVSADFAENFEWLICSLDGRIRKSGSIHQQGKTRILTSDLQTGTYLLHIRNNKKTLVHKIVIHR